jgi:alpha-tubulin suppressor-like RCC1 family protein
MVEFLMPSGMRKLRYSVFAAALTVSTSVACLAQGQGTAAAELAEAEQLVVMIRCTIDGQESIGAGIIFGAANDRLYVVTANHVVRRGATAAENIRIELRSLPGEPVPATIATSFDARRDVAVLSIAGIRALGIDTTKIAFDRLGAPGSISRGDGMYALGFPQGRPWGINVAPAPMSSVTDSLLTFETTLVSRGHSGGALLNARHEIVGLLLNVQPPDATARNITQVLGMLRDWRFPVALRGRFALAEPEVVSAGAGFTCALRRDGAAFCWGSNDDGELGTGTRGSSLAPVAVSSQLKFASVSAGWGFACALTTVGAAYCWGNADTEGGPVPGTAMQRRIPSPVPGGLTFASLSAGFTHVCGVTTSGAVYCWGENAGRLGNGSVGDSPSPVKAVSQAAFKSVSAGLTHTCGLATDGRAFCWGDNRTGALGTGDTTFRDRPTAVPGTLRFTKISAGNLYTCGVATDGVAYCWGRNEDGELGNGTTTDTPTPRAVAGGHKFKSIHTHHAGGHSRTCGLTTDGAAYCWGAESESLGQFQTDDDTKPGPVVGDLTFASMSLGLTHACGVTTDGRVYCWGDGRYGQLGNGATEPRITPGLVPIP